MLLRYWIPTAKFHIQCTGKPLQIIFKPLISPNRLRSSHQPEVSYHCDFGDNSFDLMSQTRMQVLGVGSTETEPFLALHTPDGKCLFNAPESATRVISAHLEGKYSSIQAVFISSMSWSRIGGLFGITCEAGEFTKTLKDKPMVTLAGPTNLSPLINHYKNFSQGSAPTLIKVESYRNLTYKLGPTATITGIPIVPQIDDQRNESRAAKMIEKIRENNAGIDCDSVGFSCNERDLAIQYVVKVSPSRRKIRVDRLFELGLPSRHKLYGELTLGKVITLEDGRTVNPVEVLTQQEEPSAVLLVDCPSLHHLAMFSDEPMLCHLSSLEPSLRCIFHMTPIAVFRTEEYQSWIRSFNSLTQHVAMNHMCHSISLPKSYILAAKFHLIHPDIYPKLHVLAGKEGDGITPGSELAGSGEISEPQDKSSSEKEKQSYSRNIHLAAINLSYHFGKEDLSYEGISSDIGMELAINETLEIDGLSEALGRLKDKLRAKVKDSHLIYPKFTFLGTASRQPSNSRNVSSCLVQLQHETYVLLDCGEDTYGQLLRHFGAGETSNILRRLHAVFLSHMHADHHMGLFTIIRERYLIAQADGLTKQSHSKLLYRNPLYIFATSWIKPWISEVLPNVLPIASSQSIQLCDPTLQIPRSFVKATNIDITSAPVDHCRLSVAYKLSHADGFSIVYTGDTSFSKSLAMFGKGCTVLITEATYSDHLEEMARDRRHLTFSQAVKLGSLMKARYTILTHFSQRLSKIPILPEGLTLCNSVCFANDHLQVAFNQLELLPLFNESLYIMFSEYIEDAKLKDTKRKVLFLKDRETKKRKVLEHTT